MTNIIVQPEVIKALADCVIDVINKIDWQSIDWQAVAEQSVQNQWIPVSERLPEPEVEVIVTDRETTETYSSWYLGNGYWECDNGTYNNRIIAWMPLPKPYKEGDQHG